LNDHSSAEHGSPARFSRPLTGLYVLAVVGFVAGALLWAPTDEHASADAPLDVADVILMLSWALLVVAAAMTAMRRWAAPKH
jgi:hypothetical protein